MDAGPLALVGGTEFMPSNEPQDRLLVAAANAHDRARPAFVIATAAARQTPERAVATARDWFGGLGLDVEELPLRRRGQANDRSIADLAATGRFFYLCGGDPGIVPEVLSGSLVWRSVLDAWRSGAPLAGSSAGAMALGEWTLIRARMPGDSSRTPRPGLGVVPRVAVLPHYDAFGERWIESARAALPESTLLGIDERTAAVWKGGHWRAMGAGSVRIIAAGGTVGSAAGDPSGLPIPQPMGFGPG